MDMTEARLLLIIDDGVTANAGRALGGEEVAGLGEFDGEMQYREDRYRNGRSVADVVIDEKNRENRMRRKRPRLARWDWTDLMQGHLESILRAAGIPKTDDE